MTSSRSWMDLARDEVRALPLYSPDVADCAIDLSDNTNLWGMPPAVAAALAEPCANSVARYPSLYAGPLRDAILGYLGHDRSAELGVVTGCGSDDVIDSTMRAFARPGARIAFSAPTFSMIPTFAALNGIVAQAIPFSADCDVDAERLVDCRAAITYVCTPNNPTAAAASRASVEYVVANAHGIVLLDEAYAEFAPETFMDLVTRFDGLIVARTFSKAFGLAGLRVGYGVAQPALANLVARARGPYKVNALAERAVMTALGSGEGGLEWVREHACLAVANRERLSGALRALGVVPLPSAANFVCVPHPQARSIAAALRSRGILVRALSGLATDVESLRESDGAALRIGVGPWPMMQILVDALPEVLA